MTSHSDNSSGRRLSGLVNDILDFSKLKHHDIILNIAPVNLYSLVQLVKAIMRSRWSSGNPQNY